MAELASQPTSIQTIYTWYREEKIFVNRRYQRKLVWTTLEKRKLIESVLKKYPIPAILLAEREGHPGSYEIIDGLQRLHTIISFIEHGFGLDDDIYFNVGLFPTAKAASTSGLFTERGNSAVINSKETSTILDYSLAISVMRNATEVEINDVFDRINTYGHRLSDQERRQSGVQNEFSGMVRALACTIRGDSSEDILLLSSMPSISIDLPMSNHGYEVKADEIFWVYHGILRSTDLRDSLDEQCIADIAACIVGGSLIERSKDALDEIYTAGSHESNRILAALTVYGKEKVADEIKFCIDELLKVCAVDGGVKLRRLVFSQGNTNAFPAVFTIMLVAFHEIIVGEKKKIRDYNKVKLALTNLSTRIGTGQKAASVEERRKNINVIKGLISDCFIEDEDISKRIYNNHSAVDIESIIRRSEIELANYELKQGILTLKPSGGIDMGTIKKM